MRGDPEDPETLGVQCMAIYALLGLRAAKASVKASDSTEATSPVPPTVGKTPAVSEVTGYFILRLWSLAQAPVSGAANQNKNGQEQHNDGNDRGIGLERKHTGIIYDDVNVDRTQHH